MDPRQGEDGRSRGERAEGPRIGIRPRFSRPAESKIAALKAAGIAVAESPATIGQAMAGVLGVATAAA